MEKRNGTLGPGAYEDSEKGIRQGRKDKEDDKSKEEEEEEVLFKDLSPKQKAIRVLSVIARLVLFLGCLFIFICSLGLLESAFQLLGGRTAGQAFSSGILSNPLAGLMIGVLATVLVQSSSTSTSIVVTMVGSDVIPVEKAVPIVMGANIGTSVTNTLVSLAQANRRDEFRRAFAGATVHDMFNWLAVIILLPLEIAVGYLHWLSGRIVASLGLDGDNEKTPDMLKAITKPVISSIVKVNKHIISDVAANKNDTEGDVLVRWCKVEDKLVNVTHPHSSKITVNCNSVAAGSPLHAACQEASKIEGTNTSSLVLSMSWNSTEEVLESFNIKRCDNLFAKTDLSDAAAGAILLIIALALVLGTLMLIVKILNSMLSGSVSRVIKNTINADFPDPFGYFTGYAAMMVGIGMTMVVQSSSVFTSTLTPLVGLGIVSVERMYPMTLGSNVGTTITAILAALSQSGEKLQHSLQIAFCHLFFNISGILIYYPIPFMRWPIGLAKILGKTTSKHRWFAIFYIILMFVILPGCVFALSYAGWIYLGLIGGPIFLFFLLVALINVLQVKRPNRLPPILRTWNFLPDWMHSLKPVDRLIAKVFRCKYCQTLQQQSADDDYDEDDDNSQDDDDIKVKYDDDQTKTAVANGGKNSGGKDNQAFEVDTRL